MTNLHSLVRFVALAGIACGLVGAPGCTTLQLLDWKKGGRGHTADEKDPVRQIICVWEPSEGMDPNGLPARGFGGQILFFTSSSPTPAKVKGDVRIYVYDNHGTPEEQAKPMHQFDFIGDAWSQHFLVHPSLGPSYQVFIPYMRPGNMLAHCALRVRFTPEGGRPIFSDLVYVTLPGTVPKQEATPFSEPLAAVRPAHKLADAPLGATVNHRRISGADLIANDPTPQVSRGHKLTGMQASTINVAGAPANGSPATAAPAASDRLAANAASGMAHQTGNDTARSAALLGDAEIERLVREYHESQRRSRATAAPQVVSQAIPAGAAEAVQPAAMSERPRRFQLTPASGTTAGRQSAPVNDFDSLFSGGTPQSQTHPLADLELGNHPLAEGN